MLEFHSEIFKEISRVLSWKDFCLFFVAERFSVVKWLFASSRNFGLFLLRNSRVRKNLDKITLILPMLFSHIKMKILPTLSMKQRLFGRNKDIYNEKKTTTFTTYHEETYIYTYVHVFVIRYSEYSMNSRDDRSTRHNEAIQ